MTAREDALLALIARIRDRAERCLDSETADRQLALEDILALAEADASQERAR